MRISPFASKALKLPESQCYAWFTWPGSCRGWGASSFPAQLCRSAEGSPLRWVAYRSRQGKSMDPVLLSGANKLCLCVGVSGQKMEIGLHTHSLVIFFQAGDFSQGFCKTGVWCWMALCCICTA